MADYLRCFSNPATIHASCEDYRAAANIDLIHDEADKGRKLDIPLFAISGAASFVSARYDLVAEWQTSFTDVSAQVPVAISCPKKALMSYWSWCSPLPRQNEHIRLERENEQGYVLTLLCLCIIMREPSHLLST